MKQTNIRPIFIIIGQDRVVRSTLTAIQMQIENLSTHTWIFLRSNINDYDDLMLFWTEHTLFAGRQKQAQQQQQNNNTSS